MLFNSIDFIFFFVIVFTLFYCVNHKFRWALLLATSYLFYAYWEPYYLIIILFSTLVDYTVGLQIIKFPKSKKWLLGISLTANLGILFLFKYFNFFNEALSQALSVIGVDINPYETSLLLPVGISYYTFQTLSYTIDLYKDRIKPEPHLGKFALFVSFFPQLVAGPIERAKNLLPQFKKINQKITYENLAAGLSQMLLGFIKKTIIADTIAIYVNSIYDKHELYSPVTLFFASILFLIQVYCDFSGYTDIAIGVARTLGFRLSKNFDIPLFSYSFREFWRRWHISLSKWIFDYIYAPLRGNDRSDFNRYKNIMIVFFVMGLWHGASFNFVMFGVLAGLLLVVEQVIGLDKLEPKNLLIKFFRVGYIFFFMAICMIFFRSESTTQSFDILSKILNPAAYSTFSIDLLSIRVFVKMALSIAILFSLELFYFKKYDFDHFVSKTPVLLTALVMVLAILAIMLFGVREEGTFIYFQF